MKNYNLHVFQQVYQVPFQSIIKMYIEKDFYEREGCL